MNILINMKLQKLFFERILGKQLKESYEVVDYDEFEWSLRDLATLDLDDSHAAYPDISNRKEELLFGGRGYDLYILDRTSLPSSGPFEIVIRDDDNYDVIGFIRGTKSNKIVSFNFIHIQKDFRGQGMGKDIYSLFLDDGYTIKSDEEITDATYSLYDSLVKFYKYTPLLFDDGRVGLKK